LVYALDWQQPTNVIQTSSDQGLTWDTCEFDQDPARFSVISVYQDLGLLPQSAWIFATTTSGGVTSTNLIYVNFTRALPPCGPSDYEAFNPEGKTHICILGQSMTFTRKKQTSLCVPDPAVLNNNSIQLCPCTRADYYCVYCYISDANLTCVPDNSDPACDLAFIGIPVNCTPGSNYTSYPPYRKVIGSQCTGDIAAFTQPLGIKSCPSTPVPTNPKTPPNVIPPVVGSGNILPPEVTGWIVFGVLMALVGISIVVYVVYRFVINKDGAYLFRPLEDEELQQQG